MRSLSAPDWEPIATRLLEMLDLHPVLMDIGASGPPRQFWTPLANRSTFIGFDPDLRELKEVKDSGFQRAMMLSEAVKPGDSEGEIEFYLTKSPYCSSSLEPDMESLSQYAFAPLFEVERKVRARATTLPAVMQRVGLTSVEWFKTDSQGTDLRLFNSLPDKIRAGVLCAELEPGLIDAYKGEDLFVDAHRDLLRQGFWLSAANICGSPRMRQSTAQAIQPTGAGDAPTYEHIQQKVRISPGWIEATYLRSLEWLVQQQSDRESYALLWVFAAMGAQYGFALDVAVEYEKRWGVDDASGLMKNELANWLKAPVTIAPKTPLGLVKSCIPVSLKQWLKDRFASK